MKTKILSISAALSLLVFFAGCSNSDDNPAPEPDTSVNPLAAYLITSGFNEKTTNQVNLSDYEFGYSFIPTVNGKINAFVVKIPGDNPALRLTLWNKSTATIIKTETINYPTAGVEVTKAIDAIDVTAGTEYMVTFNSNDWYDHRRNAGTDATYPVSVGDINITGYAYRSGTSQIMPTTSVLSYYAGDISIKFKANTPTAEAPKLTLPSTLANTTALNVPDAGGSCGTSATAGNAQNSITITSSGIIADPSKVSIEVDLTHAYSGDVVLELFTPGGASCGLIKRIGAASDTSCGSSADFITGNKLTFNSANTTLLASPYATGNYAQTGPTTGTFPTTVFLTPLATFLTGKNIKGVWKLKMYDYGNGDAGVLNSWKITFAAGALQ